MELVLAYGISRVQVPFIFCMTTNFPTSFIKKIVLTHSPALPIFSLYPLSFAEVSAFPPDSNLGVVVGVADLS